MDRRQVLIGSGALFVISGGAVAYNVYEMGSLENYRDAMLRIRTSLKQIPEMHDLVRFATLAPSGHNTQPWKFRLAENQITILPDLSRRTAVVDPDDHHLWVSLGAAAETFALAAAEHGYAAEHQFNPSNGGSIEIELKRVTAKHSVFYDAIPKRQSSRTIYNGRPILGSEKARLIAAASIPDVDLTLLDTPPQMRAIRDLIITGNSLQIADPAFITELKKWLRFNPHAALIKGDGLFTAASGNPMLPTWCSTFMFDRVFRASSENDKCAKQVNSSAGVAVFTGTKSDPEHWVQVGRACQRFALQATSLGIQCAFLNQPVEVTKLRPKLAALIGLPGRRPDIIMRYGRGPTLPYAPRRPVGAILI